LAAPGQQLEGRGVRAQDHVGLVAAGEALDRGAVDADALGEGDLEVRRRDRDRLQRPRDVAEPQPDEPHVLVGDGADDVVMEMSHGASLPQVPDPARAPCALGRHAPRSPEGRRGASRPRCSARLRSAQISSAELTYHLPSSPCTIEMPASSPMKLTATVPSPLSLVSTIERSRASAIEGSKAVPSSSALSSYPATHDSADEPLMPLPVVGSRASAQAPSASPEAAALTNSKAWSPAAVRSSSETGSPSDRCRWGELPIPVTAASGAGIRTGSRGTTARRRRGS